VDLVGGGTTRSLLGFVFVLVVVRRWSLLEGNAELLVYLVEEEKDVYIDVRPVPPRTCPAGLSPAKSLSHLGVAESLRTGKWRPRRG